MNSHRRTETQHILCFSSQVRISVEAVPVVVRYFLITNDSTGYQKFDINEKSFLIFIVCTMILFCNTNNLIFTSIKM